MVYFKIRTSFAEHGFLFLLNFVNVKRFDSRGTTSFSILGFLVCHNSIIYLGLLVHTISLVITGLLPRAGSLLDHGLLFLLNSKITSLPTLPLR